LRLLQDGRLRKCRRRKGHRRQSMPLSGHTYKLDTLRFQLQTSIADEGGTDTIEASLARAGGAIDLTPGHMSSVGVTAAGLAAVNNLAISPGSWIEPVLAIPSATPKARPISRTVVGTDAADGLTGPAWRRPDRGTVRQPAVRQCAAPGAGQGRFRFLDQGPGRWRHAHADAGVFCRQSGESRAGHRRGPARDRIHTERRMRVGGAR
jgi:hypothetical protein